MYIKTMIQGLMNFLWKTAPSKSMIVIYRNHLLKHLKFKWSLLPKLWVNFWHQKFFQGNGAICSVNWRSVRHQTKLRHKQKRESQKNVPFKLCKIYLQQIIYLKVSCCYIVLDIVFLFVCLFYWIFLFCFRCCCFCSSVSSSLKLTLTSLTFLIKAIFVV